MGIDLSPIQPRMVSSNISFQVDDLEEEWNFPAKFDFIYSSMMSGAIADWPKLFQQSLSTPPLSLLINIGEADLILVTES
jgi:hypothetical protein